MTSTTSNVVELRAPRARRAFELYLQDKLPSAILDFNVANRKYAQSDVQRLWEVWQAACAYEKQQKKKAKK